MDWNRVEGNWKDMKGKIKEKWGKLTDDDLTVINGKREQLEGKNRAALRLRQGPGQEGCRRLVQFTEVVRPTDLMQKPRAYPGAFYLPLLHRDSGLVDVVAGLKPP